MDIVKAYRASDGQLFMSQEEAEQHEAMARLESWYSKHPLYILNYTDPVHWDYVMLWLKQNHLLKWFDDMVNAGEIVNHIVEYLDEQQKQMYTE